MLDVLIHVRDPGAANFVARLPEALQQGGLRCRLLATGLAERYFTDRNIEYLSAADQAAGKILVEHAPRLVLVGTSESAESLDLALIAEAKTRGIPSAAVVDMNCNEDRRFRGTTGDALAFAPDFILVPDEATQRSYMRLGIPQSRVLVTGHPHFDYVIDKRRQFQAVDRAALKSRLFGSSATAAPALLFVAEPASAANPALTLRAPDWTLSGTSNHPQQTIVVLEELISALSRLRDDPLLIVRLHPKNDRSEFAHMEDQIDVFSSGGDPLESVWAADVVVGIGSMLLMEASLLGKATLAVMPKPTPNHWLPCVNSGATPCVWTRSALENALQGLLEAPDSCGQANASLPQEPALPRVISFIKETLKAAPASV